MTVVSILAVMLAAMAPSFISFLAGQQCKALSYDLLGDLMLARNEALKRNGSVSVASVGSGWAQGWTVAATGGEALGHRNAAAQSVTVSGAPALITFDANGRVSAPLASVRITVSGSSSSRCIALDPSGRARTSVGVCT